MNYAAESGSEQVGLLHDTQELLLVHLTVTVAVRLIDHFLELFIGHALAKLLRDPLEILKRDLTSLVIVKETERLEDLVLWVPVQDLMGHHLQELRVLNSAASIIINIGDHLLNLLFLWLEAKCAHGHFEFFGVNRARTICVKQIEGLLDLLLLLLSQLLLLLPTGVELAESHLCNAMKKSNCVDKAT